MFGFVFNIYHGAPTLCYTTTDLGIFHAKCRLFGTVLTIFIVAFLRALHMKLVKPFTPHVIAWFTERGFNQSICRTKEQETRLQCLSSAMPKSVMPSAAKKRKVSKEKKCKDLAVLAKSQ